MKINKSMKFKSKTTWVGLFLIGVMVLSTFAYAVIQAVNPGQNVKLPESNIIDYQLDPRLRDALVQNGATLMTFDYNLGCRNCVAQKATLEFFANEYKNQIFLEELSNESLDVSQIYVISLYGEEKLTDANETQIFSALCKLMVAPPPTCALTTT